MNAGAAAEGGCLCGAVRYRVSGAPIDSNICHCNSCARAAGAPGVAWVTFAAEHFAFVRGAAAAFQSSPPVTRTFCATCGTPLTYRHVGRAGEVDVTTRSLDEPELFPPTRHEWLGDAPAWDRPGDGLPVFQGRAATAETPPR